MSHKQKMISLLATFVALSSVTFANADPIAYWTFDEPAISGGQPNDQRTNSINTLHNYQMKRGISSGSDSKDPQWAEGIKGNAWKYSAVVNNTANTGTHGSSGWTSDTYFDNLNLNVFTIEGFFKLDSLPGSGSKTNMYTILDYTDYENASNHKYTIRVRRYAAAEVGGDPTFRLDYEETISNGTSAENININTTSLSADKWYWFGVTRDASNKINISLRDMDSGDMFTNSKTMSSSGLDFSKAALGDENRAILTGVSLAENTNGDAYHYRNFDGLIDDIRISDQVLSPEHMLYNSIPEPGSLAILGLTVLPLFGGRK